LELHQLPLQAQQLRVVDASLQPLGPAVLVDLGTGVMVEAHARKLIQHPWGRYGVRSVFDLPVHAVLLDAGGVLLLPDPSAMRRALSVLGVTPDDDTCRRAHYASTREIDRLGEVDWVAADRVAARVLGVPDDQVEEALAPIGSVYLSDSWVPVAGATQALLALQRAGMPLAVVSNAGGTMEHQLLTHRICAVDPAGAPTGDDFAEVAVVVDSHVVGIEKPDPRIFEVALTELGVGPENAVYVGDTVHFDVVGARAAGLAPVHVDPYGFCPHDDHPHVASLADLVAHLVPAS
jgi:putative hydrolase of the HAD superfamily